jgi:hypothetical protein
VFCGGETAAAEHPRPRGLEISSKLLERVLSGEEVVIAKASKPVARILPFTATHTDPLLSPRALAYCR